MSDIYITALRNTHAMETEALQIMQRQVERTSDYPDVQNALRQHIQETEEQRRRLEAALEAEGEDPSTLKEAVMGIMGNMAAMAHMPADDEILKNLFADNAFENYEIAAYKALITIARNEGKPTSSYEMSLQEEEAMAKTISSMIESVTSRYLQAA